MSELLERLEQQDEARQRSMENDAMAWRTLVSCVSEEVAQYNAALRAYFLSPTEERRQRMVEAGAKVASTVSVHMRREGV